MCEDCRFKGEPHDPEVCGCEYIGQHMWSCGHIDCEAQHESDSPARKAEKPIKCAACGFKATAEIKNKAGVWVPWCAVCAKVLHPCQQCGDDLGNEWFLGAVCGRCCRANHRKVTGRK